MGVEGGATKRLSPIGRQALCVLGVEAVAECVADHLVSQHPVVPRPRQPEKALAPSSSLVHSPHASKGDMPVVAATSLSWHLDEPVSTARQCTPRLIPQVARMRMSQSTAYPKTRRGRRQVGTSTREVAPTCTREVAPTWMG
jgi:hypothetical protein